MRTVTAEEARQALLDLGFTPEGCLDRMEGEGMPEFAAWETLYCLLCKDGADQLASQAQPSEQVRELVAAARRADLMLCAAMHCLRTGTPSAAVLDDGAEASTKLYAAMEALAALAPSTETSDE